MTSMSFEVITKDVTTEVDRVMERLTPTSMASFLEESAVPWLSQRAAERFGSEGDEASGKWAPLAPATQEIRREGRELGYWSVAPDHPINVRTHELEDYITGGDHEIGSLGSGAMLLFPGNKGREMFPNLQAKIEQAQRGGGTGPARPVLAVALRDVEFLLTALKDHVMVIT